MIQQMYNLHTEIPSNSIYFLKRPRIALNY